MILYYALGGGLGHLTRGRRVLEALGLTKDAAFVTASPYASDARVTGGIPVISEIARDAERMIVDAFPCGIQGELSDVDMPMDLVARRVKWSEYRREVPSPLPRFDTVWCVEELEPEEQAELRFVTWSAASSSSLRVDESSRGSTTRRLDDSETP